MSRTASGHALFVTLIVLALIALAVGLLAANYGFQARLVSQEARRIHLGALADAAVAESLANLADSSMFTGIAPRDFGGGVIRSHVEGLPGGNKQIVATATYRGWIRRLRIEVRIEDWGLEVISWSPVRSD